MVMSVIINNDLIVYLINGLTLENIPCNMQLVFPIFSFPTSFLKSKYVQSSQHNTKKWSFKGQTRVRFVAVV